MDILYIGNDQQEIGLLHRVIKEVDSTLVFDSAMGMNDAFQKIYHCSPRVILMQPQRDRFCCQLLSSLKHVERNLRSYFLLIDSTLTSDQVEEFHALGVHYFIDKKIFFKKTRSMVEIITRSIGLSNK
jgi:hypothetical protein